MGGLHASRPLLERIAPGSLIPLITEISHVFSIDNRGKESGQCGVKRLRKGYGEAGRWQSQALEAEFDFWLVRGILSIFNQLSLKRGVSEI